MRRIVCVKVYQYINNKPYAVWPFVDPDHIVNVPCPELVAEIEAKGILEADAKLMEISGINPAKDSLIGCIVADDFSFLPITL